MRKLGIATLLLVALTAASLALIAADIGIVVVVVGYGRENDCSDLAANPGYVKGIRAADTDDCCLCGADSTSSAFVRSCQLRVRRFARSARERKRSVPIVASTLDAGAHLC